MSSYISPERRGEGESLLRELAARQAVQPAPAPPQGPVPPGQPSRPSQRAAGPWLLAIGVAAAAGLGFWWWWPTRATPEAAANVGPVGSIVTVSGTVAMRPEAAMPDRAARSGDTLFAVADIRTESGELTLRTGDAVTIRVEPLSRVTFGSDGVPELQFGAVDVDTRGQTASAMATSIRTAVTGTSLAGDGATFSIHSAVHADVVVHSGAVVLDQGGVTYHLKGGDCRMVLRSGQLLATPGACE